MWSLSLSKGALKLEQNCGSDEYPITELGKRCQATCGDYNGCRLSSLNSTDLPHHTAYTNLSTASIPSSDETLPQMMNQVADVTTLPTSSPVVQLDCLDKQGTFKTNTGASQTCSWFDTGNGALKRELNCQGDREARLFCQSKCGEYNGCDDMTCTDSEGLYTTYSGWTADCSWLLSGQGEYRKVVISCILHSLFVDTCPSSDNRAVGAKLWNRNVSNYRTWQTMSSNMWRLQWM